MIHQLRRFVLPISIAAIIAGVIAGTALAWSQVYVQNVVYGPGNGQRSAYNSNLKGNDVSFADNYGGTPQMCSEYVNSNGVNLDSPVCHPSSFIDLRTVSYGAARCWSDTANLYDIWVNECATNN